MLDPMIDVNDPRPLGGKWTGHDARKPPASGPRIAQAPLGSPAMDLGEEDLLATAYALFKLSQTMTYRGIHTPMAALELALKLAREDQRTPGETMARLVDAARRRLYQVPSDARPKGK